MEPTEVGASFIVRPTCRKLLRPLASRIPSRCASKCRQARVAGHLDRFVGSPRPRWGCVIALPFLPPRRVRAGVWSASGTVQRAVLHICNTRFDRRGHAARGCVAHCTPQFNTRISPMVIHPVRVLPNPLAGSKVHTERSTVVENRRIVARRHGDSLCLVTAMGPVHRPILAGTGHGQ